MRRSRARGFDRSGRRRSTRRRSGSGAARRFERDGVWHGDVIAPLIRDLGVGARDVSGTRRWCACVLSAQMAKAGPPMDGKDLHVGDFAWGVLPPAAPLAIGTLTMAGMAMAFARDGIGRVARLVHRRRRLVARRVARGDQSLRRPKAAGDLLRPEQPDGAVDARSRSVGGPRVRRQGRRLWHARHHHRRHRSRRDRGRVHVGGRARARRTGPDAHRAGRHAHVRSRPSRRHAVSRQGSAAVVGLSRRSASRAMRTASCTRSGRRAIRFAPTPRGSRPRA